MGERGCAPYFRWSCPDIWRENVGTIPMTMNASQSVVQFTIDATAEGTASEIRQMKEPNLSANVYRQNETGALEEMDIRWSNKTSILLHIFVANWNLKESAGRSQESTDPLGFVGDMVRKMSFEVPKTRRMITFQSDALTLEIYAIHPGTLCYLRREGILTNFLRFALAPHKDFKEDVKLPYKQAITDRVFAVGSSTTG